VAGRADCEKGGRVPRPPGRRRGDAELEVRTLRPHRLVAAAGGKAAGALWRCTR